MRKVSKTTLVKRFMDSHPMAQALVLEAITRYAVEQLDAEDWVGVKWINQDTWREVAQAALDQLGD